MISIRNAFIAALGLAVLFVGFLVWRGERPGAVPEGFAQGNGRIEAVEIDIASKYPGRIEAVLAHEGQLVEVGQAVVQMDTRQLRPIATRPRPSCAGSRSRWKMPAC